MGKTLSWFALRLRSNFERQANMMLSGSGFETFLPTYRERRSWSDRVKELECPLFPGYMFCRLDPLHRLPLLKTPGVVNIVGFGSRPEPIPDTEIASLRSMVECRLSVRPWPFLHIGQKVQIRKGPLTGVEGILVQFKSGYRIVVSISLLQRSVAAELDGDWLHPIDEPTPHLYKAVPVV